MPERETTPCAQYGSKIKDYEFILLMFKRDGCALLSKTQTDASSNSEYNQSIRHLSLLLTITF